MLKTTHVTSALGLSPLLYYFAEWLRGHVLSEGMCNLGSMGTRERLEDGRGVSALDQPEGCWISFCHGICLQGTPTGAKELPPTPSNQTLPCALL